MGYPTGIDPVLPVSQTSVQATTLRTPRAGILGFEPRLTQSKCAVLPLHYTPTNYTETHWDSFGVNYLWNNPQNQCVFVWWVR